MNLLSGLIDFLARNGQVSTPPPPGNNPLDESYDSFYRQFKKPTVDLRQIAKDELQGERPRRILPVDREALPAVSFNSFIDKTLRNEGGYTTDQGGPTNLGITWRDNEDVLKSMGYDSEDALKDLTSADAKRLYNEVYYKKPGFDRLPDDLQYLAFDFGVNSGPKESVKQLQRVIGAKADGVLGKETLAKVASYNGSMRDLQEAYLGAREDFYKSLAKSNPKKHGKSLKGWLNRIKSIRKDIFND